MFSQSTVLSATCVPNLSVGTFGVPYAKMSASFGNQVAGCFSFIHSAIDPAKMRWSLFCAMHVVAIFARCFDLLCRSSYATVRHKRQTRAAATRSGMSM